MSLGTSFCQAVPPTRNGSAQTRMSPTVLSLMPKHAATVVSEPVSVLQPARLAVETMDVAAGMRIVAAAMLIPTPRLSRAAERLDAAAAVAHPPSKWLPEP